MHSAMCDHYLSRRLENNKIIVSVGIHQIPLPLSSSLSEENSALLHLEQSLERTN